jgi:RimJ/RimL family protein N-acetyltransferase
MSGAVDSPGAIAPELHTERLCLRAHRADDHAALAATWADPAVYRFLSGKPTSSPDAWMRLLRYPGLWSLLGYGYWAVEEKASGQLIGDIGYADFRRGMTPSLDGMPELGWVLASQAHGKGYASEALVAVQAWGDAHFGAHRSCCIIDPQNTASIRLAAKAGFVFWKEGEVHGTTVHVFTRDA